MVSATLSDSSSRRGRIARYLLRDAYRRLDRVGAICNDDARGLIDLGVRPGSIVVTGDTRYDQAWQRAHEPAANAHVVAALTSDRPTLVAGSTWPPDEEVLLPAWLDVRQKLSQARLIIAPHEPTEQHVVPLQRWAERSGLSVSYLGDAAAPLADVLVVNRLGVLGDLYALATAAFVGGGFHAAGLHSVLEPAAFGAPVVFGPRHANSRDAGLLLSARAAREVASSAQASEALATWLGDRIAREQAGAAARALVDAGTGAARRSFDLVMALLLADPPAPLI
jgi:3-deoxy-D-manno-octulosonic-acid transferase